MNDHDAIQAIARHLVGSAETKNRLLDQELDSILAAGNLLVDCLASGGKVLLCGNGGSAADCQHLAAELVSSLNRDLRRRAIGAIALTTDSSVLTAYANDFGFEGVFERQVQALGTAGDLLIAISTSGSSANVIRAIEGAKRNGLRVCALTGQTGGKALDLADVCIRVPSSHVAFVQESHIVIGHILCHLAEQWALNQTSATAEAAGRERIIPHDSYRSSTTDANPDGYSIPGVSPRGSHRTV
jgi:D-sedoheptulose 7-phosphate isomerase